MNVSDWIAEYLSGHYGIKDIFGYQGTMVAWFADAIDRCDGIQNHSCQHEQGASFAACGYALSTGRLGAAYATSGPGAVNLLQGVANAYMDSTPVIYITGQVNTYEYAGVEGLRQQAFQEIDIVSMAAPVTKFAATVRSAEEAVDAVERACHIAVDGRPGPVLVDIPMDIQRAEVNGVVAKLLKGDSGKAGVNSDFEHANLCAKAIAEALRSSERPLFLLGRGSIASIDDEFIHFIERHSIPVVTSLPARTVLPTSHPLNLGHVGVGYGMRAPNIVADRIADLVVCLGASLCTRQVGVRKEGNFFAERAKVIRVDIDECSLKRRVGAVEDCYIADVRNVLRVLKGMSEDICSFQDWADVCTRVREDCARFDDSDPGRVPNNALRELSAFLPKRCSVFVDVGQHMMWASHSMELGEGRRVFFSGGHGAMGWSLPAAIGAAFGSLDPVVVVTGDGGLQMNIQELQMASSNHLPIKVIVLNNSSLGMIVACQESYLEGRRVGTDATSGYTAPNFSAVAAAYGIGSGRLSLGDDLSRFASDLCGPAPFLLEILLPAGTQCNPKAQMGDPMWNQRPYLPEGTIDRFMAM